MPANERGKRLERLDSLYPKWRSNPRNELEKFIPSKAIADHLIHDAKRCKVRQCFHPRESN